VQVNGKRHILIIDNCTKADYSINCHDVLDLEPFVTNSVLLYRKAKTWRLKIVVVKWIFLTYMQDTCHTECKNKHLQQRYYAFLSDS